jgi:hypothetical protein
MVSNGFGLLQDSPSNTVSMKDRCFVLFDADICKRDSNIMFWNVTGDV